MLRSFSSPYLVPDDMSVPCRLRRCDEDMPVRENATRQEHGQEVIDITCTMRKWHKERNSATEFASPLRRNSSKCQTKVDDAELILVPVRRRCLSGELFAATNGPIPLSKRFASFGTPGVIGQVDQAQSQCNSHDLKEQVGSEPQLTEETTIPVKDIIQVVTRGEYGCKNQKNAKKRSTSVSRAENSVKEECRQQPIIRITTSTSRSYELLMESSNEHLVLMTFLKANSSKGNVAFVTKTDDDDQDKINEDNPQSKISKTNDSDGTNCNIGEPSQKDSNDETRTEEYQSMPIESNPSNLTGLSSGEKSFDVEALQAKTMAERLKTESFVEKLERRMHRLISSLDDLSTSLTNCACGCLGDSSADNIVMEKPQRRNTASTVSLSEKDGLEVDPSLTPEDITAFANSDTVEQLYLNKPYISTLPSGLSVESEDPLVDELLRDNDHSTPMRLSPQPVMASDI